MDSVHSPVSELPPYLRDSIGTRLPPALGLVSTQPRDYGVGSLVYPAIYGLLRHIKRMTKEPHLNHIK